MLLTRNKVQPRNLTRLPHQHHTLKNKLSLPQTSSSAKAVFQQMKLTLSHQIHQLHSNQFQLNIIPPQSYDAQPQHITKKFSSPQWILSSHMDSSYQNHNTDTTSQNPEITYHVRENSVNQYENSSDSANKTQSQDRNQLPPVNKSQIQRILEMTVSDDKQRQMNETHFKSIIRINDELQSKSAFLYQPHKNDSQNINQTTFDLKHASNKSAISYKPKSAIIRPSQNLDHFYRQQMEMFSAYGLKPYEENRLRKIQELEKKELLKEQADNIDLNEAEQNQEYFNRSKCKKTGEMNKLRKCSAVVETCVNERGSKDVSRKSVIKSKHSLSKGKKLLSPKLTFKKA